MNESSSPVSPAQENPVPVTPTPIDPAFRPSSVLNFFISFIPGAGHMYQGMLQRGAVLMALFAGFITLTGFFSNFMPGMGGLLVGIGVTGIVICYFYSFFDSIRTCRLLRAGIQPNETMGEMNMSIKLPNFNMARKGRTVLGVLLAIIGAVALASIYINRYVSYELARMYIYPAMELLVPSAMLILGVILIIRGRKRSREQAQ